MLDISNFTVSDENRQIYPLTFNTLNHNNIFGQHFYLQTSTNMRDPSGVVTGCGTGQEVIADMTSDSMVDKFAYEDAKK